MGSISTRLLRPFRNFNVEERAHKVISKDKPERAPIYESMKRQIELVNKLEPDYKEKAKLKNVKLDENLKHVYVTSNTSEIQEIDSRKNPDRPLPQDKYKAEEFEFGFYESEATTLGKISLRNVLECIAEHSKDPKTYTAEVLAAEHKIDLNLMADILEYYKPFKVIQNKFTKEKETKYVPISTRSGIMVKHTIKQEMKNYGIKIEEKKKDEIKIKEKEKLDEIGEK